MLSFTSMIHKRLQIGISTEILIFKGISYWTCTVPLGEHHPYAPLYQQAYEIMRAKPPEEHTDVHIYLYLQQDADERRYNLPTVDEIAAIVPGDGSADVRADRDIILRFQGGDLHCISNLNPSYLPLHYVLLFPTGQEGWHLDIPLIAVSRHPHHSKKVTQTLWYAHCLHTHPLQIEPSNIFKVGRLFQQLVCDAWAFIDHCNLTWVANNQVRLRADM